MFILSQSVCPDFLEGEIEGKGAGQGERESEQAQIWEDMQPFFPVLLPTPTSRLISLLCLKELSVCHKTCETGVGLGISHFLWCLKILSMVSGHKPLEPARLYLSDFTIFVAGMVSTWSSAGHPALSHGGVFPG